MGRDEEIRAAGRLVGDVLAGGVGVVREVHEAIAARAFRAVGPVGGPVRLLHDGIAAAVYHTVRGAHAIVPRVGFAIAARTGPPNAPPLSDTPRGDVVLGVVNGLWGDRMSRRHPALALPMTVRSAGQDVPIALEGLRAAYPRATSRVVLFAHGLGETDRWWSLSSRKHYGNDETSYGSLLERDLGYTPVYLRYNTGHRVSDNGRRLAALIESLVGRWPVPVGELVLVGHSMGGLVVRSACHYGRASEHRWTALVRHVFCLGTPHLGAPLEKGVNAAAWLLARLPGTGPAAKILNLRSVGVKDLRFGAVVEEDWRAGDADEFLRDRCTEVPFLDHATYYFIGVTVTRSRDHPLAALVGDLFVHFPSASGQGRRRRIPFAVDNGRHLGQLHHFDLLNHPDVYRQLNAWLAGTSASRAS
jgi:hypothetical protein